MGGYDDQCIMQEEKNRGVWGKGRTGCGYASCISCEYNFNLPVQVEKSGLEEVCKRKDEVLAAKEQEIAAKERALSDERQRVSSLTDECATLRSELERLTVSHI